jgi:hypothetical protein
MKYDHIVVPAEGERITLNPDFSFNVPNHPIVPFVEGDGIGIDVTPVMRRVVDAAVDKAYAGKRRIAWVEIYAGEKSNRIYGAGAWFPDETPQALRDFVTPPSKARSALQWAAASARAQRRDPPAARSLRLRAPDSTFPRCLYADEGFEPGGNRGFPREHRGHLRRHRVARRLGRGAEADRVSAP